MWESCIIKGFRVLREVLIWRQLGSSPHVHVWRLISSRDSLLYADSLGLHDDTQTGDCLDRLDIYAVAKYTYLSICDQNGLRMIRYLEPCMPSSVAFFFAVLLYPQPSPKTRLSVLRSHHHFSSSQIKLVSACCACPVAMARINVVSRRKMVGRICPGGRVKRCGSCQGLALMPDLYA